MSERNRDGNPALVVFGIVLIGIAAWFSWGLSANQTEIRMRGEQNAKLHIEYAEDRIEKTCIDRKGRALMDCIHQEITSAQEHSRAERDLEAQKAMALWAKLMTLVTAGGTIVGVGGIYLVWRTLKASESATKAAFRAVEVTERIGRDQSRAYVHVNRAEVTYTGRAKKDVLPDVSKVFQIHLAVKNSGATPAKWYEISGEAWVHDRSGVQLTDPVKVGPNRWPVLPSKETLTCPFHTLETPGLFETLLNTDYSILSIEGMVSYETEFGEIMSVDFQFFTESEFLTNYANVRPRERKPLRMTRPTVKGD